MSEAQSESESESPLLKESIEETVTDEVILLKQSGTSRLSRWWKLTTLAIVLAGMTVITISNIFMPKSDVETAIIDCGSTNEEAMSRGCFMEPMVYGWMPPACYFEDLSTQYHPFTERYWYSDPDFADNSIIPVEDILSGKHEHIYAHWYHTEHCLFLWRKLAWAVHEKSPWLDHKTLSISHTDHCSKQLSRQWEGSFPNGTNNVKLGFYHCVKMPWR